MSDFKQFTEKHKNLPIKVVPLTELRHPDYNPRKMTDKQMEDLTKSLQEFGQVDPLVVNVHPERKGIIVGGNQRYEAMKNEGYSECVIWEVNLPVSKEMELNIRLNKNVGSWDYDTLYESFNTDDLLEWGFETWELELPEEPTDPFFTDPTNETDNSHKVILSYETEEQANSIKARLEAIDNDLGVAVSILLERN